MKKLLIVIDLQNGWRHKTATEQTMLRAVELCRQFPGDVMHCCFKNDPNSLFYTQLNWSRFIDDEDTAQIPEIQPLKLTQYWRNTYSCVNDETLRVIQQYDHVYIAGVFTDISVAATAMAVFDHNIPVSVVVDCVATLHGEDVHQAALKSMDMAIGTQNMPTMNEVLSGLTPAK